MSRFVDAKAEDRCCWTIRLRDGSAAQCGRYRKIGPYCTQHAKMLRRRPIVTTGNER